MHKLTKFELSEIVAKWGRGSEDEEVHFKIRGAIMHAQRIIEEKNKKDPLFNSVSINATKNGKPVDAELGPWKRMWKSFDETFRHFDDIFK